MLILPGKCDIMLYTMWDTYITFQLLCSLYGILKNMVFWKLDLFPKYSVILCSLHYHTMEKGQTPFIISVIHHHQNRLESIHFTQNFKWL
jgi:hypothetical protein